VDGCEIRISGWKRWGPHPLVYRVSRCFKHPSWRLVVHDFATIHSMKYHYLEKEKPWYNEQRHSILGQTSSEQQNTSRKQDRIDTENPEKYITYWFVQTWCIPRFHGLWSSSPNKRCKIWLFYSIWGYTSSVIHFQENPDFSKVMGVRTPKS